MYISYFMNLVHTRIHTMEVGTNITKSGTTILIYLYIFCCCKFSSWCIVDRSVGGEHHCTYVHT